MAIIYDPYGTLEDLKLKKRVDKMRYAIITIIIFACLLIAGVLAVANADDNQCVPHQEAIDAWSDAIAQAEPKNEIRSMVQAVCTPCSCPINGMAACYEYLADKERDKLASRNRAHELLNKAMIYGICSKEATK